MSFQLVKINEDQYQFNVQCLRCGETAFIQKNGLILSWGERFGVAHTCLAAM